jgi:sec-independent protein translocase protein TatC
MGWISKFKRRKQAKDPNNLTFIEHLEELRWRIIKILAAVLVGAIVCFFFREFLRDLLFQPLLTNFPDFKLRPESPQAPFILAMKLSLIGGIILGFPIIIYQIAAFTFPGLYPHEKRAFWIAFPFILLLFSIGIYFAYMVIIPIALRFFIDFGTGFLPAQFEMSSLLNAYADFLLILVLMIGLSFQFPILVLVLIRAGITDDIALAKLRPYVLIGIMTLALFITPEILSMILFTIPMYGLFEFSLLIGRFMRKRMEKQEAIEKGVKSGVK